MDEDQRYERFEDNDFEEGRWIGGEYFYTNAKKRRVQTKDEQLYGYESNASDDDRRRQRGKGGGKKAADYTRPVGFVSSGVVKSTDEKPQDVEAAEHAPAGLGVPSSLSSRPPQICSGLARLLWQRQQRRWPAWALRAQKSRRWPWTAMRMRMCCPPPSARGALTSYQPVLLALCCKGSRHAEAAVRMHAKMLNGRESERSID